MLQHFEKYFNYFNKEKTTKAKNRPEQTKLDKDCGNIYKKLANYLYSNIEYYLFLLHNTLYKVGSPPEDNKIIGSTPLSC